MQADTRANGIQSFQGNASCDKLQNAGAFVIAVALCVLFSVGFMVSGFSKFTRESEIKLQSRINPNVASIASLVRLPGIGISRAAAVVAYRENFDGREPNRPAFQNYDDLQKVRGIGPKTAQNISRYLKFE